MTSASGGKFGTNEDRRDTYPIISLHPTQGPKQGAAKALPAFW